MIPNEFPAYQLTPLATEEEHLGLATQLRLEFDIVSAAELAMMLNRTEQTLADWRKTAQGPVFTKLGNSIFYRRADIHEWIEDNLTAPMIGVAIDA